MDTWSRRQLAENRYWDLCTESVNDIHCRLRGELDDLQLYDAAEFEFDVWAREIPECADGEEFRRHYERYMAGLRAAVTEGCIPKTPDIIDYDAWTARIGDMYSRMLAAFGDSYADAARPEPADLTTQERCPSEPEKPSAKWEKLLRETDRCADRLAALIDEGITEDPYPMPEDLPVPGRDTDEREIDDLIERMERLCASARDPERYEELFRSVLNAAGMLSEAANDALELWMPDMEETGKRFELIDYERKWYLLILDVLERCRTEYAPDDMKAVHAVLQDVIIGLGETDVPGHGAEPADAAGFLKCVLAKDAEGMRSYFSPGAFVNWHCTNERFTAEEFIHINCRYPGEWDGEIERTEVIGNLTVTVARVYPKNGSGSYHVVSFFRYENGGIISIDEYRADDGGIPGWRERMRIGRPIRE